MHVILPQQLAKVPEKWGHLMRSPLSEDTLGNPIHFAPCLHPPTVQQLTSGEVSHTNPLHLEDLFTVLFRFVYDYGL